ncbi:HAMP domain-containing protein [Trinickia violacea]|uniref:HAMP domain-containing protein n=1 Tax=Trinickia violacea TaxID=2571746 RepID=A0A4P8ISS4_9BURK|nr:methyl-accepting chemotaxis protein [Trinickia violacea]QCP51321.1 HAMP domain-containing protein [Trinickia violacea]
MCVVAIVSMSKMADGTTHLVEHDWAAGVQVTRALDNERGSIARVFQIASDPSADRMREARDRLHDNQSEYDDALQKLGAMLTEADGQAVLAKARASEALYNDACTQTIALVDAGKRDEAVQLAYGDTYVKLHRFADDLRALSNYQAHAASLAVDASARVSTISRTVMIAAALLAVLAGSVLAWAVTRRITRPLATAVFAANQVAAGDFTVELRPEGKDEIADLLHALNEMASKLSGVLRGVGEVAAAVTSAAHEIAAGNIDLSQRTEQQAASLEETAASMEELTSTVQHNAGNARHANEMSARVTQDVGAGANAVDEIVATMQGIAESSKNVEGIITVIESIAFQTNILALNAAVEAARAGEQGRGFAVVAGEVRTLAQRSASAAREIRDLISDSVARVAAGSTLVHRTGETMTGIRGDVERVSGLIAEIAGASEEQGRGIGQVSIAVTQMDEVTQQNAALVEEAAAAAQSLSEQAARLQQTLTGFKLRNRSDFARAGGSTATRKWTATHAGAARAEPDDWAIAADAAVN